MLASTKLAQLETRLKESETRFRVLADAHQTALEQLAAADLELETLAHVASHDLRQPLRAIGSFSELIRDRYGEKLDAKGVDFLDRVIGAAGRLGELLDGLQTFSAARTGKAHDEPVAGSVIVADAIRRLQNRIRESGAAIHVASDLPDLFIDKSWGTQAVFHLVQNALKFTRPDENPEIEIARYGPTQERPHELGLVVRDRGPGVDPAHAERVFRLFQRAVGREVEGVGQGLGIVRQVAISHGGRAWVEPRAGGGAEFFVTFGHQRASLAKGGRST